ncbi:MAG: hypothetical protein H0V89_05890 [Deltaproteobacteria bacterium]|nr:hypothetical protein [Deltaproteobacteria bacterium]
MWALTPGVDDTWLPRASFPGRGSAVTGVVDGRIYVAGGWGEGAAVDDLAVYDPATDAWADLAPMPAPRDHACGAAIDGVLVVVGGRMIDIASHTDTVFRYDPASDAWTQGAPMPTGRGGAACGVVGGELVVVGGEGNPNDPSGVFSVAEAYDAAADTWRVLPAMITPRHGMAAGAWGEQLFVPGGATIQAFGASEVHEILTIPSATVQSSE